MICVATKAGKNKAASEDTVIVGKQLIVDDIQLFDSTPNGFVCVADGVGGHAGGAVASHFVGEALIDLAISNDMNVRSELLKINAALLQYAKDNPQFSDMATTLTGVLFVGDAVLLLHVGNTRAYALQGGYLKQLTSDHTVYKYLCSLQRYEEAEKCNKNEITNCLGGGNENFASKIIVSPIPKAKKYLITSDGVHEYVSVDFLEEILGMNIPVQEKCARIIDEAQKNGSADDLSVVFIVLEEGV